MHKYTILVVDDEKEIADAIEIYLSNQQYRVLKAYDGKQALEIFEKNKIDLVIMDIMMPQMDGREVTVKIRQSSVVPVIMLSAKSEDMDKIAGLHLGADDYVTKPFNPMELLARVNSQLRRYRSYGTSRAPSQEDCLVVGSVELNRWKKELRVDGWEVKLTPLEYKILELLMSHPGRVFSIEEIYRQIWGEPAYHPDTVTVHIRRIREKIEIDPGNPQYLKVVWGIGYKFIEGKVVT